MPKRIHWLLDVEDGSPDAVINSMMASQRLRAGCMMRYAKEHNSVVTAGKSVPLEIDRIIIGKVGANRVDVVLSKWVPLIQGCRSSGIPITLDFTDNHLDAKTELTNYYNQILNLVDNVVCSSEFLMQSVKNYFSLPIFCVPDAIDIDAQPPKSKPHWPRTILWFGHGSNLGYLANFLPRLQANVPIKLLILSDIDSLKSLENAQIFIPKNLIIELRTWSLESMKKAAMESDCCIIPSDPTDPRKAGVSANRLLTSLALGLPTIANKLASYMSFAEYFSDIDDPASTQVVIDPVAYLNKVSLAQQMIIPNYSMKFIAQQWFINLQDD